MVLGDVNFGDATNYTAGGDGDPDHKWRFNLAANSAANVVDGDDGTEVDDDTATTDVNESQLEVTDEMIEDGFMIRVQARQPNVDTKDVDGTAVATWKTSDTDDVAAKN